MKPDARLLVSDSPEGYGEYAAALSAEPSIGSLAFTRYSGVLLALADELRPNLILLARDGEAEKSLPLICELNVVRTPECGIMTVTDTVSPTMRPTLRALGVTTAFIRPVAMPHLVREVSNWMRLTSVPAGPVACTTGRHHAPHSDIATLERSRAFDLVLSAIRQATVPLSATEVGERCGLSAVTSRRYLKRLASQGDVRVLVRYQSTGRPAHVFSWCRAADHSSLGSAPT